MDEIALVTAIAPIAPDLPAAVREAARATLLTEIAAGPAVAPGPATRPAPRRGAVAPGSRRLARWAIAGSALAAAAASAAIVLPGVLTGSPSAPARHVQPPAPATAAAVLLRAARATAAVPDLAPRPDQFVYTESVSQYETAGNKRAITRTWLSVDGWHGGLTLIRYPPGTRWYHGFRMYDCRKISHSFWYYKANCPSPPAYRTSLPKTLKGMTAYLDPHWGPKPGFKPVPPAVEAISGIMGGQYLVPHRAAALMFQALSRFKGIKVIEHATTLAGRKGIGVAAYDPTQGWLDELIFDPKTYLYIGDTETSLHSNKYLPKGTVRGNALLQAAVVDKPGQLP